MCVLGLSVKIGPCCSQRRDLPLGWEDVARVLERRDISWNGAGDEGSDSHRVCRVFWPAVGWVGWEYEDDPVRKHAVTWCMWEIWPSVCICTCVCVLCVSEYVYVCMWECVCLWVYVLWVCIMWVCAVWVCAAWVCVHWAISSACFYVFDPVPHVPWLTSNLLYNSRWPWALEFSASVHQGLCYHTEFMWSWWLNSCWASSIPYELQPSLP